MVEKNEEFSESGEAIAKAVHRLKDIGAGVDEGVDVRSESQNGVEVKLNDDIEQLVDLETKLHDESDWVLEDLRKQFKKLENDG